MEPRGIASAVSGSERRGPTSHERGRRADEATGTPAKRLRSFENAELTDAIVRRDRTSTVADAATEVPDALRSASNRVSPPAMFARVDSQTPVRETGEPRAFAGNEAEIDTRERSALTDARVQRSADATVGSKPDASHGLQSDPAPIDRASADPAIIDVARPISGVHVDERAAESPCTATGLDEERVATYRQPPVSFDTFARTTKQAISREPSPTASHELPTESTIVHVTIGRIEVRAPVESPMRTIRRAEPPQPKAREELDAYLRDRASARS